MKNKRISVIAIKGLIVGFLVTAIAVSFGWFPVVAMADQNIGSEFMNGKSAISADIPAANIYNMETSNLYIYSNAATALITSIDNSSFSVVVGEDIASGVTSAVATVGVSNANSLIANLNSNLIQSADSIPTENTPTINSSDTHIDGMDYGSVNGKLQTAAPGETVIFKMEASGTKKGINFYSNNQALLDAAKKLDKGTINSSQTIGEAFIKAEIEAEKRITEEREKKAASQPAVKQDNGNNTDVSEQVQEETHDNIPDEIPGSSDIVQ